MKRWQEWSIRGIILLGLLAAVFWVHSFVSGLHTAVEAKRQEFEQQPLQELHNVALETELKRREAEIQNVLGVLVQEESVVTVVESIEQEALERGVVARVDNIEAQVPGEEAGAEANSPITMIKLQVTAEGAPHQLLQFLYHVEHLPYLLHAPQWRLSVGGETARRRVEAQQAPEEGAVSPGPQGAHLNIDVMIAVDTYDER